MTDDKTQQPEIDLLVEEPQTTSPSREILDTRILVERSLVRYSVIKDITGISSMKDLIRPDKLVMLIKETMFIVEKYSSSSQEKIPGEEKKKIVRDVLQEIIRKSDVSENTRESMLVVFDLVFSDSVDSLIDVSRNSSLLNSVIKNKSEFFKKLIIIMKKILKFFV